MVPRMRLTIKKGGVLVVDRSIVFVVAAAFYVFLYVLEHNVVVVVV